MMWLSDLFYLDEGAVFLGDVLSGFSAIWWIGTVVLLAQGVLLIAFWPSWHKRAGTWIVGIVTATAALVGLFLLPQALFVRDNDIWGTHSEYGQSSSYRARYNTMYNAQSVYDICGIYQLTFRDFWKHQIYPALPSYQIELRSKMKTVDAFFEKRGEVQDNAMTGIFEGKNVVLVLMESMDDWMINEEDTPTISRLMEEGINFTNFYTPFYGSARTLNTEFCANSGIYLPTNGHYVFDYVTNHFNQTMAAQLVDNGYTAEVFHYNEPSFYSRGVFEPAMGYNKYNTYEDYTEDEEDLYDECYLFNNPDLNDLFFREGQTFNFIITRSAHLSYVYNEVLSYRALKQYPEYRGKYGHEEVDCAMVKAKLVDDLFARLLQELEARGQLENTVIVAITDHYTYGFDDVEKMLELSGVDEEFKLEKTPCFIWSADGPAMEFGKTLNTSDLLPTVLNLMGIDSPYHYLGQDAFDKRYVGYALFPDGSWIVDGTLWRPEYGENMQLLTEDAVPLTAEQREEINAYLLEYGQISNLLLTTDYYRKIH
jgi:phosphoglycerol transferase MdoB-like AlkP superfamily enzyme